MIALKLSKLVQLSHCFEYLKYSGIESNKIYRGQFRETLSTYVVSSFEIVIWDSRIIKLVSLRLSSAPARSKKKKKNLLFLLERSTSGDE